jgi:hypothetical protein
MRFVRLTVLTIAAALLAAAPAAAQELRGHAADHQRRCTDTGLAGHDLRAVHDLIR